MRTPELQRQVETACRHLLSEQNRDPYTLTYGCFDRRYWGWKLVDYAEATYQRNVYPLAWWLKEAKASALIANLTEAVLAGLQFSLNIQHADGSFDQAFPHEHSFGATAFVLPSLLKAYQTVQAICPPTLQAATERGLRRAADFLCRHDETHGHIANHLAGAASALLACADFYRDARYAQRASVLLAHVLAHQSPEGWFLEYEGADPGYQTLCLYYLAQAYHHQPEAALRQALERAIGFLAWFAHPDGTFGGEYGSRRTAIYYPGGLALLSREFPMAASLTRFMLKSASEQRTVTLGDVDIGNLAPLLENYILALEAAEPDSAAPLPLLPCAQATASQDFTAAGLHIRSTPRYYAVVGASNGGVLKVFDRQTRALIGNDVGYVGQASAPDVYVSSQMTIIGRACRVTPAEIEIPAPFYHMLRSVPTTWQFVALRLLNLTLMRSTWLGNLAKEVLVRLLISGKRAWPLHLTRTLRFEPEHVVVDDDLRLSGRHRLRWLENGRAFVAIHMASARYFQGALPERGGPEAKLDVEKLNRTGQLHRQVVI